MTRPPRIEGRALALVILVAALAGVCGVASWMLFGDGAWSRSPEDEATAPFSTPATGTPNVPEQVVSGVADTPPAPVRAADLAPARGATPAALEQAPLAEEPLDPVVVEVLTSDGLPAAGARVAWIDPLNARPEELPQLLVSADRLQSRGGSVFAADEDGVARVPRPRDLATLIAGRDGERGVAVVVPNTFDPVELRLGPPIHLDARVIDESGAPVAGVQVAIANSAGAVQSASPRATTDASGLVAFRDLDIVLAGYDPREWFVGIGHPIATDAVSRVSLRYPPIEPVVLVLPQTGSMRITLVDEMGARIQSNGRVDLSFDTTSSAHRAHHVDLDDTGTVLVPIVGVGLRLKARVVIAEHQIAAHSIDGPQERGELVDVELSVGRLGPVLVGTLADDDGNPLKETLLHARLDRMDDRGRWSRDRSIATRTSEAAEFRLDFSQIDASRLPGARRFTIETEPAAGIETLAQSLDVEIPREGVVDLGGIRLAPLPRIAAGIVVDEGGVPVEGASVGVRLQPDGSVQTELIDRREWSAVTGADGRFDVRGAPMPGVLKISARRNGFQPSGTRTIVPGDEDIVLVLARGGSVYGSLLLDEEHPAKAFQVALEPAFPWVDFTARPHAPNEDGSFSWPLVAIGLHDFHLRLAEEGGLDPLLVVPGIDVRPLEATRDARLIEIDVAALVNHVRVDVRDPSGEPVARGEVVLRTGPQGKESRRRLADGKATLLTGQDALDLDVVCPGFRVRRVAGARGHVLVTLDRGFEVELVLTARLAARPDWPPRQITVSPLERELSPLRLSETAQFEGDVARARLPAAGRYAARLVFAAEGAAIDRRARSPGTVEEVRTTFEVADVARRQRIELTLKSP